MKKEQNVDLNKRAREATKEFFSMDRKIVDTENMHKLSKLSKLLGVRCKFEVVSKGKWLFSINRG